MTLSCFGGFASLKRDTQIEAFLFSNWQYLTSTCTNHLSTSWFHSSYHSALHTTAFVLALPCSASTLCPLFLLIWLHSDKAYSGSITTGPLCMRCFRIASIWKHRIAIVSSFLFSPSACRPHICRFCTLHGTAPRVWSQQQQFGFLVPLCVFHESFNVKCFLLFPQHCWLWFLEVKLMDHMTLFKKEVSQWVDNRVQDSPASWNTKKCRVCPVKEMNMSKPLLSWKL